MPQARIIVLDNRSTDGSPDAAEVAGATVITIGRRGKGGVMRAAFDRVEADLYVIIDGDGTYAAEDVPRLIEPILAGEADMTLGARTRFADPNALSPLHRLGNWLILGILNFFFHTRLDDVLSGYRVLSAELVQELPLLAYGFEPNWSSKRSSAASGSSKFP